MDTKNSRQIAVISLVLAVHLAVDLGLLLTLAPQGPDDELIQFSMCLAWPMGQGSLIAVWAAISRIRSYLRFFGLVAGLSCTWLLLVAVVPNELRDLESATYLAMFTAQAMTVLLVTMAGQLVRRQITMRRIGQTRDRSRQLQYDLATLLLWTVGLALTMGFGRLVVTKLGWTAEGVVGQRYFFFAMVFGVGNAVYATLVLASLTGRVWWITRTLPALIVIGLFGYFEPFLLESLFGDDGGIAPENSLVIAASQAAYLYATLLPLRLCGCFRGTMGATQSCRRSPTRPADFTAEPKEVSE